MAHLIYPISEGYVNDLRNPNIRLPSFHTQMTVHMFPGAGYDSNIFLVTGDESFLIDAGSGAWSQDIIDQILRVTDSISKIILTHKHFDHVGGAAELSSRFQAPVFMHHLDAEPVRSGSSRGTESDMFGCAMPAVEVTELQDGQTLSTGAHDLEIIHTPGHTPGGIALYDHEHKILFSGDTVFADGVGRWDLSGGNLASLKQSVRKLSQLDAECLYPGHGSCIKVNAKSKIENALRYVEGF